MQDETVKVYSLEYTRIQKVFFTPHHGGYVSRFLRWQPRLKATADLYHSYSKGITCINGSKGKQWYPRSLLRKCDEFIVSQQWPRFQFCNNVPVPQWLRSPLLQKCVQTRITVPTVATMCSNDTAHTGCLVPSKKRDRQTRNGPQDVLRSRWSVKNI
jgi:hypothetical protein